MRDAKVSTSTANVSSAVLRARRLVVTLVAACAFSILFAAGASATIVQHKFEGSFKGSGTNELKSAVSIGVDNSGGPSDGAIYVGDKINARVVKFDPNGNFLFMFGDEVNETSTGDICPRPGFPGDTCKAGVVGSGPGAFTNPKQVIVDWTSGPSSGDVYVLDPDLDLVQKFTEDGELITTWGGAPEGPAPGQLNGEGIPIYGTFETAEGIGVESSGNLVVSQREFSPSETRFFRFSESGTFINSVSGSQSTALRTASGSTRWGTSSSATRTATAANTRSPPTGRQSPGTSPASTKAPARPTDGP